MPLISGTFPFVQSKVYVLSNKLIFSTHTCKSTPSPNPQSVDAVGRSPLRWWLHLHHGLVQTWSLKETEEEEELASSHTCPCVNVWVTRKCNCDTGVNERKADLACHPTPKLSTPQTFSFVCFCLLTQIVFWRPLADEWNGVKGEEGGTIRLVTVESQSRSRPFKKTPYWVHDDNLSLNPSGEPTLKMIKSIFHSTSLWPRSGVLKYHRGGRSRSGWMECFGDLPPFKEKYIMIQVGNMPNCQF